jgi:hypothetical protein
VVCPYERADFGAVGRWYDDFREVEDDEVLRLLGEASLPDPTIRVGSVRGPGSPDATRLARSGIL